jgi:hypothetical protein
MAPSLGQLLILDRAFSSSLFSVGTVWHHDQMLSILLVFLAI